jgi:hypothetical protein
MQQSLLRYYENATGCIGHATKETQHVTLCYVNWYEVGLVKHGIGKYRIMKAI